jgi:hypothetical protein
MPLPFLSHKKKRHKKKRRPQKNFGRPVEWAMVRDHPWSTPQLRRLEQPVDAQGKPWVGGAAAPAAK